MKIKRFEDVVAWQKARVLTKEIYLLVSQDQLKGDYGLVDQIRRASGSIMHNIAEGFDAGSDAEFVRFLRYSYRSASEVQSQLYMVLDIYGIEKTSFDKYYESATEIKQIISGLIGYLLRK
jgi:four helix bundle protein